MVQSRKTSSRSIGVLLHPTALPGDQACGSFGAEARIWVESLARNGIRVWQLLPLAPTDSTGSPYSSPSSLALNPLFLDPKDLVDDGFLSSSSLDDLSGLQEINSSSVEFTLAQLRSNRLGYLLREEWPRQSQKRHFEFNCWCEKQFWLEDHVSFVELSRQNRGRPWWKWSEEFSLHNKKALSESFMLGLSTAWL